ncbi:MULTISPECIES: hypothetical protein [Kitasatospora]|uniref:hypothetical protein n=1 Tax=Kitasatospora TaxID=2063 RepID=UPI0031DB3D89
MAMPPEVDHQVVAALHQYGCRPERAAALWPRCSAHGVGAALPAVPQVIGSNRVRPLS